MDTSIETQILNLYDYAKDLVYFSGYREYIEFLENLLKERPYKTISKDELFREYVWVVFTCGFKADTVRKHWEQIKDMLDNFDVEKVRQMDYNDLFDKCPIKNKRKVSALHETCQTLDTEFLTKVKQIKSENQAKEIFQSLPFIGEVTVFHIMRNLGIDCFKPDRHIVNLAKILEIEERDLFQVLQAHNKSKYIGITDFILWRASACLNSAKKLIECAKKNIPIDQIENLEQADKSINAFLF